MNILQRIWQKIASDRVLLYVRFLLAPKNYKIRSKRVFDYYKDKDIKSLPDEIGEGLSFLKNHKFTAFPFRWTLKYEKLIPVVSFDEINQCFYINYLDKKLYYKKNFTELHAIWATRSSLKEQDPQSPHLYLTTDFQVEAGSIVVDAGVAEGNFALSVVEQAKKLYLIECDAEWMEALKLTFAPWKDKVVFVEKFLSGTNDDTNITLDEMLQPDPAEKYFIKMDIEGFEKKALLGAQKLFSCGCHVKMDICTYHFPDDVKNIGDTITNYGFNWKSSDGYILFFWDGDEPSFRKALIRADNKRVSN